MRIFYLFQITEQFEKMYRNNPSELYKILDEIRNLPCDNYLYGLSLYKQLCIPFNKKNINEYIYNRNCNAYYYQYTKFKHSVFIRDINEKTTLIIKYVYLHIETNVNYPYFLKSFKNNNNIFVCDFNNQDYFWLNKMLPKSIV